MSQKIPFMSPPLLIFLLFLLSFLFLPDILALLQPFSLLRFPFISSSSESLPNKCDYSNGKWVWDENYYDSGSYSESCPFLDRGFQCIRNGRKDTSYRNWRWQPHGCNLPRFNASDMLHRSRNKRIVFVGDSIGRNQWESLLCMLFTAVRNKSAVYEVNGNPITKHKGFLSIKFANFNLTVEYYRSPYLVAIGRPPSYSSNNIRSAIHVDTPTWLSKMWAGADVVIFNTGHWWNSDKTIKQGKYFQVGKALRMTMNVKAAFQKSIETIMQWGISNMKTEKSFLFFRSYSPSHYRNGTWDTGGTCDSWMEPETINSNIAPDPWYNQIISDTIQRMKGCRKNMHFLNVTYLTELRKDGHASRHREPGTPADAPQDCSHWCLPGVPDTWNEFLYTYLLSNGYNP